MAGGTGFAPHSVPRTDAPTPFGERAAVPDPRGRRHPPSAVLGLAAPATLVGRTSPAGIARFGRQYGSPLASTRGKTPSPSTSSRTPAALDAAAVETAPARRIAARLDPADAEHPSRDGKTFRGSRDGDVPGVHLAAAFAPRAGGTRPDPRRCHDERARGRPGTARHPARGGKGGGRRCRAPPAGCGRERRRFRGRLPAGGDG